jgi:6-phosphogluconolactonase
VQHTGHGGDPLRQEGPHAHWIGADPANRFVLVADLGLDAILRYRFDATHGTLGQTEGPACRLPPGSGPRHLAFHPDGRHAYVINELDSTVVTCAYDSSSGALWPRQRVSTLPADVTVANTTAAVRVAPSGRFVYGSNRGHDSIVVFASDPTTGHLTSVEHVAIGGQEPRDFTIDPTGTWLLVAQHHSDRLASFRVDATSGRLRATGQGAAIAAPVCLACSRRPAPEARG